MYDFIDLWFRQMLVSRTASLLTQKQLGAIRLLGSSLLTKNQDEDAKYLQQLMLRTGELNVTQKYAQSFVEQDRRLIDSATYAFSRLLEAVDQRLLTCEFEQILEEVSPKKTTKSYCNP